MTFALFSITVATNYGVTVAVSLCKRQTDRDKVINAFCRVALLNGRRHKLGFVVRLTQAAMPTAGGAAVPHVAVKYYEYVSEEG